MEKRKKRKSRTRPNPVSCQSCRSKKLKCNRSQPCTNCIARSINCVFLVPPTGRESEGGTVTPSSNEELLRRIQRLESLLLSNYTTGEEESYTTKETVVAEKYSGNYGYDYDQQRKAHDLQLLENIGVREDPLLSSLSKDLAFQTSDIYDILRTQSSYESASEHNANANATVVLPTYIVAVLLLNNYETNVDHVCRILHKPSVRSHMKTFYLHLSLNQPISPSHAALFLAIFSLSAFFYTPFAGSAVATIEHDAVRLSKFWSKAAWDVLNHTLRYTSGCLEDVQACIILSYTAFHIDGFSARVRLLSTIAVSIVRDLRLHRLDAADSLPLSSWSFSSLSPPSSLAGQGTRINSQIDDEVKRRVFWHIASTDWLHSTISGPQQGTYFLHPRQICVRLPQNYNDEDMALVADDDENRKGDGSQDQPTSMTFFLERVRLAHICREMTDTIPLDNTTSYERIMVIDRKLQHYLSTLPVFFRLDLASRTQCRPLEAVYPHMAIMRYCLSTAAHTRRCRLHQKFLLLRPPLSPADVSQRQQYAYYSRKACLESARAVVQVFDEELRSAETGVICDDGGEGHDSDHDNGHGTPVVTVVATARMAVAVHFTHLALAVMVLDLCFNQGGDDDDDVEAKAKAQRKSDVAAAFRKLRMVQRKTTATPLLGRSLDALGAVLRKYHLDLAVGSKSSEEEGIGPVSEPVGLLNIDSSIQTAVVAELQLSDGGGSLLDASSSHLFDELLQTTIQGDASLDVDVWDKLLSSLDTRPI